jgi:hypothetical protein
VAWRAGSSRGGRRGLRSGVRYGEEKPGVDAEDGWGGAASSGGCRGAGGDRRRSAGGDGRDVIVAGSWRWRRAVPARHPPAGEGHGGRRGAGVGARVIVGPRGRAGVVRADGASRVPRAGGWRRHAPRIGTARAPCPSSRDTRRRWRAAAWACGESADGETPTFASAPSRPPPARTVAVPPSGGWRFACPARAGMASPCPSDRDSRRVLPVPSGYRAPPTGHLVGVQRVGTPSNVGLRPHPRTPPCPDRRCPAVAQTAP